MFFLKKTFFKKTFFKKNAFLKECFLENNVLFLTFLKKNVFKKNWTLLIHQGEGLCLIFRMLEELSIHTTHLQFISFAIHLARLPKPIKIFKQPKNREESFDFNDFRTKRIVSAQPISEKNSKERN